MAMTGTPAATAERTASRQVRSASERADVAASTSARAATAAGADASDLERVKQPLEVGGHRRHRTDRERDG